MLLDFFYKYIYITIEKKLRLKTITIFEKSLKVELYKIWKTIH